MFQEGQIVVGSNTTDSETFEGKVTSVWMGMIWVEDFNQPPGTGVFTHLSENDVWKHTEFSEGQDRPDSCRSFYPRDWKIVAKEL